MLDFMLETIKRTDSIANLTIDDPWVACTIVRDGVVIAQATNTGPGLIHAEVNALKLAGDAATGADLYTNLEPCAHVGLNDACADKIIQANLKRVLVAVKDPDPKTMGKGLEMIRQAGIDLVYGNGFELAYNSLFPYLVQRYYHRPYISYHSFDLSKLPSIALKDLLTLCHLRRTLQIYWTYRKQTFSAPSGCYQ